MNKVIYLFLISFLFAFTACEETQQPKVAPPAEVSYVSAVQIDLPVFREFIGSIYGYKDIPIRARVEGFLETIDF
jgi:membrane fusion protein (multidrug efflux system)